MQDPRSKKVRDFRRAFLSSSRPSLYRLFEKLNPEYSDRGEKSWRYSIRSRFPSLREWYDLCEQRKEEWIRKSIGCSVSFGYLFGNAPAWFRRQLNRKQRTREKRILNKAFRHGDWDDLLLPRCRRNANWLWW